MRQETNKPLSHVEYKNLLMITAALDPNNPIGSGYPYPKFYIDDNFDQELEKFEGKLKEYKKEDVRLHERRMDVQICFNEKEIGRSDQLVKVLECINKNPYGVYKLNFGNSILDVNISKSIASIIKSCVSLTHLEIYWTENSVEGWEIITKAIEERKHPIRIELRGNDIDTAKIERIENAGKKIKAEKVRIENEAKKAEEEHKEKLEEQQIERLTSSISPFIGKVIIEAKERKFLSGYFTEEKMKILKGSLSLAIIELEPDKNKRSLFVEKIQKIATGHQLGIEEEKFFNECVGAVKNNFKAITHDESLFMRLAQQIWIFFASTFFKINPDNDQSKGYTELLSTSVDKKNFVDRLSESKNNLYVVGRA